MRPRSSETTRLLKIITKVVFLFGVYFAFAHYTVPTFNIVKAHFEDSFRTNKRIIIVGDSPVTVEVADTLTTRIQGLSGRESLSPNTGMLFVFEKQDTHGIWMKDMNFAIDIIWFDKSGQIIHFKENALPESYPETFTPPRLSMYVLEVPAGFVKEKHLKLGDSIDFK